MLTYFAVLLTTATCPLLTSAVTDDPVIVVPTGQRQLFMDDYVIDRMQDLVRSLHQPVKKGAVIRPDLPWETTLQTRCTAV